jgi:hypothetical protein
MPITPADNPRVFVAVAAVLASTLAHLGCAKDASTRPGMVNDAPSAAASPAAMNPPDDAAPDYWGEYDATAAQKPGQSAGKSNQKPNQKPNQKTGKTTQNPDNSAAGQASKSEAAGSGKSAPPADAAAGETTWSLVVATFTEGDHSSAAQRMIAESRTFAPQVQGLRVHPTAKGSMVVYGHYAGRDDDQARNDIAWLKSIKYQNQPVFRRVIITQLDLRPLSGELSPHDLLSARRKHPKVNPLYTLDVAIWDDFDSGQMTYEQIRRKAEAYAMQLRQQGHDAYFYHDNRNERSTVTVGLFDRTAIDSRSGLYSSAVKELIAKFPQRLVNGEPMFEYETPYENKRAKDARKIKLKPQTPVLALVPDS